eukprot:3270620-Amphidinium_carterae.1
MREQLERTLRSLEPQIRQHLAEGYARRWRVLEADAEREREYDRAKLQVLLTQPNTQKELQQRFRVAEEQLQTNHQRAKKENQQELNVFIGRAERAARA